MDEGITCVEVHDQLDTKCEASALDCLRQSVTILKIFFSHSLPLWCIHLQDLSECTDNDLKEFATKAGLTMKERRALFIKITSLREVCLIHNL